MLRGSGPGERRGGRKRGTPNRRTILRDRILSIGLDHPAASQLRALVNEPTHKIPAIAEKIKKLEARSDAIRRRLQVPCPTKYGNKEAANDCVRLMEFSSLRANETALTEVQETEEAHLRARFDVFGASPESIARRRREALQDAERQFKGSRLTGEFYAAPLSRKDRNELELLRWLYPEPKRNLSQLDGDGPEVYRDHPFADELLAPNGNFYPRHSKLRPLKIKGFLNLEGPKGRIYELEKRRAGEELSPAEEDELQDLRRRHPRIAAVVSKINLVYDYEFDREIKIALKAGLNIGEAVAQAEDFCLRLQKPGSTTKWNLERLREDGTWPWQAPASPPANAATQPSNEPEQSK
jgi:hypothetical protein